ncbi:NAD(+) diphosphatase [Marinobacterium litorale]|uniref:NAD(+) diphosphatase n=1 Tax=Marinobacterium litorale TaxID=404770 RepID=UPI00041402AB|nr:NAD(+) diphosphatase [Marinobacterium litorale]
MAGRAAWSVLDRAAQSYQLPGFGKSCDMVLLREYQNRAQKVQYILAYGGRIIANQTEIDPFYPSSCRQKLRVEAAYRLNEALELLILSELPDRAVQWLDLRGLLAQVDEALFVLYARAAQISVWYDRHRFCGRCGAQLESDATELAKNCSQCGLSVYPRISPCIIVLVTDGERCLLAHNPRFPKGRFSTLAGFIEAGETAEMAVAREVEEEVGIRVRNIRYAKSQSWPFPHSLMLGFFAEYAGGELVPDGDEITEAGWFTRDNLPDLPPPFAISRYLIDRFLESL